MDRYILYTYRGLDSFNRICEECNYLNRKIIIFDLKDTKEILTEEQDVILDITNVFTYLMVNEALVYHVGEVLNLISEDTQVIIDGKYADKALDLLRNNFCKKQMFKIGEKTFDKEENFAIDSIHRQILYTYDNLWEINNLIEYCEQNNILYISFSQVPNDVIARQLDNIEKEKIIDITSVILASEQSSNLFYFLEQILSKVKKCTVIIRKDMVEKTLNNCYALFYESKEISALMPEICVNETRKIQNRKIENITICNIEEENRENLKRVIDSELKGHINFKEKFKEKIDEFVLLNKIERKKILSVFLLGDSGIGKTEVARIIARKLNGGKEKLIKINFGNYSSQDALNSLIGSPRGYIGCDSGELSEKLSKNNIGIILCDEFEKANPKIFNFFLEVLEDGKYTDSMGKEYDLNGYIIIFTSNIKERDFFETIPNELQSRIDLVFEFMPLSQNEKKEYAKDYLGKLVSDINKKEKKIALTQKQINTILNLDYDEYNNVRDINRKIDEEVFKLLKY